MSTSKRFMENMEKYKEYTKTVNIHVKPTVGVNSGALGRLFEMEVKAYLGNTRGALVAKSGKVDTRKKIDGKNCNIEIKTGCGELARLDSDGNVVYNIFQNDLIIYAPEYTVDYPVELQAYVITGENFQALLETAGLIRRKKSSYQSSLPKELQFDDRLSIQSFTNSLKKTDLFYDLLEEYGVTLKEMIEEA